MLKKIRELRAIHRATLRAVLPAVVAAVAVPAADRMTARMIADKNHFQHTKRRGTIVQMTKNIIKFTIKDSLHIHQNLKKKTDHIKVVRIIFCALQ